MMQDMFFKAGRYERRCYNFENATMERGQGGKENKTAKGHAFEPCKAGETKVLLDVQGSGVIDHFWITFNAQGTFGVLAPIFRRGLKLEMFWDGAEIPAVSAPIGDFFGMGVGQLKHYENELFSCVMAKSLNSYLKMPFLRSAKITLTNETPYDLSHIFYTINYYLDPDLAQKKPLYFHGHWRRENPTTFKKDFEILPKVEGNGIYLGTNISVISNPELPGTWWGEGEVKIYLDGDAQYPTVIGTGAEDYPGTAWGLEEFVGRYQGCLAAEGGMEGNGRFSFYRYHIPDPIYFEKDCRVTMQQIGGASREVMRRLKVQGAKFELVSVNYDPDGFIKIYETDPLLQLEDEDFPDGWCNHYRQDDWSAMAYFYLDKPEGVLPPLGDVSHRLAGIQLQEGSKRSDDAI